MHSEGDPYGPKRVKAVKYLTYVALDGIVINIIVNKSVTVKMSSIKKLIASYTCFSTIGIRFIKCYEIFIENLEHLIMKYHLEEQCMYGRTILK
jgi:hypothetical protein